MTDIASWSPIDDNNNSAPPAGWPEGMLPAGVNNAARAMQGATRRWYERANVYGTYGGSVNDIILTYETPELLADGEVFVLDPQATNTGPVTINVNGAGAKPLYRGSSLLRGGELQQTVMAHVAWSAGFDRFLLMNAVGAPVLPLVVAGGTANVLTLAYASGGPTVLTGGDRFTVFLAATNTGPATLTVQGIGPYDIYAGGNFLVGGEMRVNTIVDFVFDGANIHLLDPALTGAFMPTAGGTFTGPIAAPGIASSAAITAAGTISASQYAIGGVTFASHFGADGTVIYDGAGTAKIITTGNAGSNDNFYRAQVHEFSDAAGTGNFALLSATGLAVTSAITATSNITATGNLSGGGLLLGSTPFAAHAAGSNQVYDGDGGSSLILTGAAGGYANYHLANTHYFQNNAGTTIGQISATDASFAGNISTGASVTGGFVGSTGNINCASFMNAGTYNLAGVALADQGGAERRLYDSSPLACIRWSTTGDSSYDNTTHYFRSRGAGTTYCLFQGAGNYQASNSATWSVVSDISLKEDVTVYNRGLDALLKLQPVSFRFAAGTQFADEAGTTRYGLVAQDVETVVPEMVGEATFGDERVSTLDPGHLLWMLLNAVKELTARIEALEEKP